jgi:hypothetical protein
MISAELQGLGIFQSLTRSSRVLAAAQAAVEDDAERLADAIRDAAPEDAGSLRESVRVEPGDDPLIVTVRAGGTPETTRTNKSGVQFDEALMSEYGTSHSEARPFFYPTIERMRDKIKSNIGDAVEDAVKQEI